MNFKKEEFTLSCGIPVVYSYDGSNDLVSVHAFFTVGSWAEDARNQGVRHLAGQMLDKGAAGMDREEIARRFESIGAIYSPSSGDDHSSFGLSVILEHLETGLGVFSKLILEPSFPKAEFKKEQFLTLQSLKAKEEDIFTVCEDSFLEELFGPESPYGRDVAGSVKTVGSLTAKETARFYRDNFTGDRMFLVVTGRIGRDRAQELLEKNFGGFGGKKERFTPAPTAAPQRDGKETVLRRNFQQAFIITGARAGGASSPDYFPLKIVSMAMGQNMSSRLFRTLREELGLAYAVGTGYPTRRFESQFFTYIGLDGKNVELALGKIREEYDKLARTGLTAEEISQAKTALKSNLLFSYASKTSRSWYFGYWKAMGLPAGFDSSYAAAVDAVTAGDINDALSRLRSSAAVTAVVMPEKR